MAPHINSYQRFCHTSPRPNNCCCVPRQSQRGLRIRPAAGDRSCRESAALALTPIPIWRLPASLAAVFMEIEHEIEAQHGIQGEFQATDVLTLQTRIA